MAYTDSLEQLQHASMRTYHGDDQARILCGYAGCGARVGAVQATFAWACPFILTRGKDVWLATAKRKTTGLVAFAAGGYTQSRSDPTWHRPKGTNEQLRRGHSIYRRRLMPDRACGGSRVRVFSKEQASIAYTAEAFDLDAVPPAVSTLPIRTFPARLVCHQCNRAQWIDPERLVDQKGHLLGEPGRSMLGQYILTEMPLAEAERVLGLVEVAWAEYLGTREPETQRRDQR